MPQYIFSDLSCEKYDKPFIIMERINGNLFWDKYIKAESNEKELMMNKFAELLYDLHQLSYNKGKIFSSREFIDCELNEIKNLINLYSMNELVGIYKWLDERKSIILNFKPVIIHRDYHPWNVIVSENGTAFVIDWVWGIGDFRFDLAWSVSLLERSRFEEAAQKLYTYYEIKLNKPIKDFEYFKALTTLRWLVNVSSSIYSGDNLRENEKEQFILFIKEPIKKALNMFEQITKIQCSFSI